MLLRLAGVLLLVFFISSSAIAQSTRPSTMPTIRVARTPATKPSNGFAMTNEEMQKRMDEMNKKAARPIAPVADAADLNQRRQTFAQAKRAEAEAASQRMTDAAAAVQALRANLADLDDQLTAVREKGIVAESNYNAIYSKYESELAVANQARPRDRDGAIAQVNARMNSDASLLAAKQKYDQVAAMQNTLLARRAPINADLARAELAYKAASKQYSDDLHAAAIAEAMSKPNPDDKSGPVSGTGWPIAEGYVVTNYHVVEGKRDFEVACANGKILRASVAAKDTRSDLVLLKVEDAAELPAPLPRAEKLPDVGERVFTIGYPKPQDLGEKSKLTDGVVSALTGAMDDQTYLQVSVPIQPGNSGGPLLNSKGEVVGIMVAKWQEQGVENVSYAIKVDRLQKLVEAAPDQGQPALAPTAAKEAPVPELAKRVGDSIVIVVAH